MNQAQPTRLPRLFSFDTWLRLGLLILLLLAIASASVLYSRKALWRLPGTEVPHDDSSIFVAPVGILDSQASFTPIENYDDTPAPLPARLPDAVAPARLLDPTWKVFF